MYITFTTKGKSDIIQIYVRLRDKTNRIDTTSKTGTTILKEDFKKGKVVLKNVPKNADAITKSKIAKLNSDLTDIETKLNEFKTLLLTAYNNRKDYELINARWIYNILNPVSDTKNKVPNELALYFDYYDRVKKGDIKASTLQKIRVIANRLKAFEKDTKVTTYIQEVNNDFKQRFKDWCETKAYHRNTYIKSIKVIVTVCNHAHEMHDIILHHHTSKITKGKTMRYSETDSTFLTFAELKKIENKKITIEKYDIARDWLLISCFTAQRISDFMRFNINDIVIIDNDKFLDIKQDKTDTPVLVFLNDTVLNIIEKYNGQFPPLFSKISKDSNEITYNRYVKKVGRLCGIDEIVTAQIKNKLTNRAETKTLPKFNFITSHIGRRSYATNYHGKINTALLISATGHSSETQFLRYVKPKPTSNATALAKAMRELSKNHETPMHVIKNASNKN